MLYELTCDGYGLGIFPTYAEARRRADFLPRGRYAVREWTEEGEYMTFDPTANLYHEFTN